jgi:hypothetical protein
MGLTRNWLVGTKGNSNGSWLDMVQIKRGK